MGFAVFIFLVVEVALVFFIVKYRRGRRARDVEGPQIRGHLNLELAWTAVPVLILVAIAIFTFYELPGINDVPSAGAAGSQLRMNVEGKQFYWQITYPNGVIAIDTMRAPVNRPVRVEVTAPENDVIHSWWIPELGGKIDAIPGHPNHTWYEVEKPGTFEGQCAEFCGIQHAAMTATVQAVPAREFDSWLSAQARAQEAGTSDLGAQEFNGVCAKCHGDLGQGGIGPNIANSAIIQNKDSLETIVRNGKNQMPAVGSDWSDAADGRALHLSEEEVRRWRLTSSPIPPACRGRAAASPAGWSRPTTSGSGSSTSRTSLFFFVAGGILALLMRAQLATPNEQFITKDSYNELFTMHGTTMVFLVIVPILAGFGNYLIPLMIGARDVAFPRLNALSYWLFLLGGVVLYGSWFASGGAPKAGWTSYVPLSEKTPGSGQDLWILSLHILSIASLIGAINFLVTIWRMRTPGMTRMRMPLFVWSIEAYSALLVLVLPALSAGLTLLLLDRQVGTHFFIPDEGGSALLWQHVFWFFGHPEVYIMILPAMGIISEVIPVFARKPVFGYTAIALATAGIAVISLFVWAHHMFATGIPIGLQAFFMISTMLVAVPDGREDLQLACDDLARKPHLRYPDALRARVHRRLHARWAVGRLPRRLPVRLGRQRHLLRRRAPALRPLRRIDLRDLRRPLLLVAEDVRPRPRREDRQVAVLVHVHRLQHHVLPAAHARAPRHAASHLHVRPRRAVGGLQPRIEHRLRDHGDRHPALLRQRDRHAPARRAGRTTPGWQIRSSGTRARRRRPKTSMHRFRT